MDKLHLAELEQIEPGELSIEEARAEIDRLDAEIIEAVKRRIEISKLIGRARMADGGTRLVHSREMQIIERYSELGPEGRDIALPILKLGRGALGREVGK